MILAITFKNKLKNQLKNHSSESKASGHHDIKLNLWHHLQVAKLPWKLSFLKNLKINTFPKLLLFCICFKLLCDIYFLFLCSFSESLRMITA